MPGRGGYVTEDKINATIMVVMSLIVNKMVTFDIGMLYRITKILSHPQSINASYNDNSAQYNMPTSQATISNPFDLE